MLHHIELYVSDLTRSIDAWEWLLCDELGYEPYQDWPEGRSYRFGETYLVFVQTESAHLTPPYHRKKTGLNHLAFYASSRFQLERIQQQLCDHGFRELYPDRFPFAGGPHHVALYFEDPDRIKVELVARM